VTIHLPACAIKAICVRGPFHLAAGCCGPWLSSGPAHAQTLDDIIAANLKSKGVSKNQGHGIGAHDRIHRRARYDRPRHYRHHDDGCKALEPDAAGCHGQWPADRQRLRWRVVVDGHGDDAAAGASGHAGLCDRDAKFDSVFVDYKEKNKIGWSEGRHRQTSTT
jgi:hypothetical protein